MADIGMDKYRVDYKKFATIDDRKFGTKNFVKDSCKIDIKSTKNSNAGMAKNKFLAQLSAKDKKLTVVTGAMIH